MKERSEMKTIDSRDLRVMRKKIGALKKVRLKRLGESVCDVIDLKGLSLALLLHRLPEFPPERQKIIAQKIEDFLYFHPRRGRKVLNRLDIACSKVDEDSQPNLFSAMVDVLGQTADFKKFPGLVALSGVILTSNCDFSRKAKALEVLNSLNSREPLLLIIENMIKSSAKLDDYSYYHFFENSLLVLKRIGGESILKLIINPNSDNVVRQFRIEWRGEKPELLNRVLRSLQSADAELAQIALKVIDLSDFNLPFISMIQEGLSHPDKWVRQAAAASMEKASSAMDVEAISRMLADESSEVRMMAVASLGGYPVEKTGQLLESLARKAGELPGAKMNALYALYSQKNLPALERLSEEPEMNVALNSIGLAALLRPKREGLDSLLKVYSGLSSERALELKHYLFEIADPEDLGVILDYHKNVNGEQRKENCLGLIRDFILLKAGPRMERVLRALPDAERKALSVLVA